MDNTSSIPARLAALMIWLTGFYSFFPSLCFHYDIMLLVARKKGELRAFSPVSSEDDTKPTATKKRKYLSNHVTKPAPKKCKRDSNQSQLSVSPVSINVWKLNIYNADDSSSFCDELVISIIGVHIYLKGNGWVQFMIIEMMLLLRCCSTARNCLLDN